MWITIRTKRIDLSPRMRSTIERFLRRAFHRQRQRIASCVLTIGPTKLGGGKTGFSFRLRLWSSYLGSVMVNEKAETIRSGVQAAALRARQTVRQQLKKRKSQARRLGRNQLSRWLTGLVE